MSGLLENRFIEQMMSVLDPYFHIEREVTGTHFSGARLRIDCVIRPKDVTRWKNKNVAFGVEFKSPNKLGSFHKYSGWLAQCVDYSHTNWDNYGYLYILSCPGFESIGIESAFDAMAHIMGQVGVGEFKQYKRYGWTIIMHATHRIWSEVGGVREGDRWSMERKWGSR